MKPDSANRKIVLRAILPEYEPAGEMISDATKARGFPWGGDGKAIQEFEDRFFARERAKLYKAIDDAGTVYLITNPVAWHLEYLPEGTARHRPAPKRIMSWGEALSAMNKPLGLEETQKRIAGGGSLF